MNSKRLNTVVITNKKRDTAQGIIIMKHEKYIIIIIMIKSLQYNYWRYYL